MKLRHVTFPSLEVRARLEAAGSLPEAVLILHRAAGSHDKLAKILGTTRQRIIKWEEGDYPARYAKKLLDLGVPARLFTRTPRDEIEGRLRRIEAEVAALRREIEE